MEESPAKKKQQGKVAGAEDAAVAELTERFFKDIQSRDRKDVTMPRYLEKDILPHIGGEPIRGITAEDVRSVIWRKKEQGFDAAAGQVRGLLKRMFDYAPGQPGHGPAHAARLPRRRPRQSVDAG